MRLYSSFFFALALSFKNRANTPSLSEWPVVSKLSFARPPPASCLGYLSRVDWLSTPAPRRFSSDFACSRCRAFPRQKKTPDTISVIFTGVINPPNCHQDWNDGVTDSTTQYSTVYSNILYYLIFNSRSLWIVVAQRKSRGTPVDSMITVVGNVQYNS